MKYLLEWVVFICGAVVMIFEIVGSRIIGPYLWTSIIVWTSIIWVILWSLSLWYYLWGIIADKKADNKGLSFIIFITAVLLIFTFFIKDDLLIFLQNNIKDLRISAVLASLILFAPVSIFLWIVSPYAVKLKIKDLKSSGRAVWKLYAISTVWSIFWTFLAGFYLLPLLWTNDILIILSILLVITSIVLNLSEFLKLKLLFILLWLFSFVLLYTTKELKINSVYSFVDIDTLYNRVWIVDHKFKWEKVRRLSINNERSSTMSLEHKNKLIYEYTRFYDLAKHFNPWFKKTLMIWWAWYSYPKYFLEKYPDKTIDVVEIDKWLTNIAKKYFYLKEDKRLKIIHEDGRVYLNKNKDIKYDVIYWDAFKSQYSLPYQLTTKQATESIYNNLTNSWVVIVNIISSITWKRGEFLRAEFATYSSVFPKVYLFKVQNVDPSKTQNLILVATKSDKMIKFSSQDKEIQKYLDNLRIDRIVNDMPILTDDYAPVDYYISKTIN